MSLRIMALAVGVAFGAMPLTAGMVEPTEAALKSLENRRVQAMGVDHAGNLWLWADLSRKLEFLAPSGEPAGTLPLPQASAVDADLAWGWVSLATYGNELQWGGATVTSAPLPLESPASAVCWLGPTRVAVAPQRLGHTVEIWDIKERKRVQILGQEEPLHPTYGVTRLRTFVLRYDFQRELLYALESFTGHLKVFKTDGSLAWEAQVDHASKPEVEAWLHDVDTTAKAARDVQTPLIWIYGLGLSPAGEPLVAAKRDEATLTVEMYTLAPGGNHVTRFLNVPCARYAFTVWGSWFISYTDSKSGRETCTYSRRLP